MEGLKGSIDESADGTNTELADPVVAVRASELKIDGPGVVIKAGRAGPEPALVHAGGAVRGQQ